MHFWSKLDYNYRRQIEWDILKEFLEGVKANKILDVACGDGTLTKRIFKIYPEAEIYGVDYSMNAIKFAKKIDSDLKFSQGDSHNLPYKSNQFDLVLSNCAIEHFQNDKKAFAEITRITKKGGTLLITTEALPKNANDKFIKRKIRRDKIINFYTKGSLQKKIPHFKIVSWTYYLSGYSGRLYQLLNERKLPAQFNKIDFYTSAPIIRLLYPLICFLSRKKSKKAGNSFGIAIKAVKK